MIASKNTIILVGLLAGAFIGVYAWTSDVQRTSDVVNSPEPLVTEIPSVAPSPRPNITKVPVPFPTEDSKPTFIDEPVPWSLLLSDASCELRGEIKFLNASTYDNQDAVFIYNGIDHPARNIKWTTTPDDGNLSVGPNIFSKMQLPYGQSLLGIFSLQEPKSKRYELTVKIAYGRLVDESGKFVTVGGNVKVFEKQCQGKTIVVFP